MVNVVWPRFLLQKEDVPSVQEEHGGVSVVEKMGVEPVHSRRLGHAFYQRLERVRRQRVSVDAQEEGFHLRVGWITPITLPVLEQGLPTGGTEGHHSLLGPLSHGLEGQCLKVNVPVLETGHFRYPKTRIQHDGYQGRIPGSQSRLGVDGPHDLFFSFW